MRFAKKQDWRSVSQFGTELIEDDENEVVREDEEQWELEKYRELQNDRQ